MNHSHSNYKGPETDQRSTSVMNRLRRAMKRPIGKIAVGLTVAGAVTAGAVKGVQISNEHHRAQYAAEQAQIAPVIEKTMIDIDNQTLDEVREHPKTMHKVDNPDGHTEAVRFYNDTENVDVIMGKTADGQPDPNKPLFIIYKNNTGTGKGTRGVRFVLTAPGGNDWVNKGRWLFGGSTEGGWGASVSGPYDTTDRGYADSGPAPLEAAQGVARMVKDLPPYDPYTYPS